MVRDLRFAWEETPRQVLDMQAEKVQESLHGALINWARTEGEGSDYVDNLPDQCIHPVGHWYEVPNLLRNGVLRGLLAERPQLQYLMTHNIDTVGAHVDPGLLGLHISSGAAMTAEVIHRRLEDRGGGLARIEGMVRLVEGLALPREEIEFSSHVLQHQHILDSHRQPSGDTGTGAGGPGGWAGGGGGAGADGGTHADLCDVEGGKEALGAGAGGHFPGHAV